MARCVLGWVPAVLLAGAVFFGPASAEGPQGGNTLSGYLERMETASGDSLRAVLYAVDEGLRRGTLEVDSRAAADSLALALLSAAGREPVGHARWKAFDLLGQNPHPAAADFMVETLRAPEERSWGVHGEALKTLVALRDGRAYPFLHEALVSPSDYAHEGVLDWIASLGDPRGVEDLRAVLADPELSRRFAQAKDPEDIARRERELAERALVRLRMGLEDGVVCMFDLDGPTRDLLAAQGLAMAVGSENEMFEEYGDEYPFVTTDVLLHTFMILYRAFLDELEPLVLAPRLREFSAALTQACLDAARGEHDGEVRDAMYGAAAYGTVLARLTGALDATPAGLPRAWRKRVDDEVALVEAASGTHASPLLGYPEDYRPYRPSGRHEDNPELAGYYRASQYARRMRFRLRDPAASRIGLAVGGTVARDEALWEQWEGWERLNHELFGPADDVTVRNLRPALAGEPWPGMLADAAARTRVLNRLTALPGPRINTMVLSPADFLDRPELAQSLALIAPGYDPATHLLQSWMDQGGAAPCWPPTGLLVAAGLLGSARAAAILEEAAGGRCPPAQVPFPADRSLATGLLRPLRELFRAPPGAPGFLATDAWEEKQINTALGAWTELEHAHALYTKDANNYSGASAMLDRFHGYVEPYPELYRMLAALAQSLGAVAARESLFERIEEDRRSRAVARDSSGEWDEERFERHVEIAMRLSASDLNRYAEMLLRLADLSERLLRGEPQTISDGIYLKNIGLRLATLSFHRSGLLHAQHPMSLVTDVATAWARGEVFQIAVGTPLVIYVAVPFEGRTFVCRGAAYSYCEWTQPVDDRWDDARWKTVSSDPYLTRRPWAASRPRLGLHRDVTREDICRLMERRDGWGDGWGGGWMPGPHEDAARALAFSDVGEDLVPDLLALAGRDTLNQGARAFALSALGAHADRPEVADFLARETAAACAEYGGLGRQASVIRFVHALMALSRSPAGSPEALAAAKRCLDHEDSRRLREDVSRMLGWD